MQRLQFIRIACAAALGVAAAIAMAVLVDAGTPGGAPSTAEENTFDLNRVGLIKSGTSLIGLRGQATADRLTVAGLASVGFSDSTRGGGAFTIGSCQQ